MTTAKSTGTTTETTFNQERHKETNNCMALPHSECSKRMCTKQSSDVSGYAEIYRDRDRERERERARTTGCLSAWTQAGGTVMFSHSALGKFIRWRSKPCKLWSGLEDLGLAEQKKGKTVW
mmetsp:Transcript_29576/g.62861  ORF Transcript_29576/g.62861 Transcript_29576/m.62861 type:complete len:121 (-) Transcript_29576:2882-3244(-)